MTNFKYGKGSLGYLDDTQLHPQIKIFMIEVLSISTVDISIIDGARNAETQRVHFDKGNSELDGTLKMSDHQIEKYVEDNLGRAIDCIPYVKGVDIWDVRDLTVSWVWCELFRALLRVDRLWKLKGIDVGLELGWTYDINGGRDYPHVSFKKL